MVIKLISRWMTFFVIGLAVSGLIAGFKHGAAKANPDLSASRLLLTEIKVSPTEGEFIEIYNPGSTTVDLSNVYLTDGTYAPTSSYYYNIVTGSGGGGGGSTGDFNALFPVGASIDPGEFQTVALGGSSNFIAAYSLSPDYELYEPTGEVDSIPEMREALPGSINGQGNLTNSSETVILYYWDGLSSIVTDLDYILYNNPNLDLRVSKTSIPGYWPDTAIGSQESIAGTLSTSTSYQRLDLDEGTESKGPNGNGALGHNETGENLSFTWGISSPTPGYLTWSVFLPCISR